MKNLKLERAIKAVGVQNLIDQHGLARSTIYCVIAGSRQLSVGKAKEWAAILGVDKAICRPDIWD